MTSEINDLIEPPIIDHLWYDDSSRVFVVTFVPDNGVSQEATEVVRVSAGSAEGRIIATHLKKLNHLFNEPITRIGHSGGGDFIFHFESGKTLNLSDSSGSSERSQIVYDGLIMMAQAAQCAFQIQSLTKSA